VAVGSARDADKVAAIRKLAWEGWLVEALTPATFRESVDLMRIGAAEVIANPDGIALTGPVIEALKLTGQMSREQMTDTGSTAFKAGVDRYREMIAATPAFVWITTTANGKMDQLRAGEAYLRANLAATGRGLAMHPVSQTLQEFAEMAELRAKMEAILGGPAQMLARVGYGAQSEPSPRWPLAAKLVPLDDRTA
jgi:hypothetical protein